MDDVVYLQGQRRPEAVTVPLASYPTFSDFKEHCRELFFENSIEASFVIATSDRKSVITDDVYRSMVSGEYPGGQKQLDRTFLVLDHIGARLEVPAKMAIGFSPHIGTLLGAGASHLNRIDDGVAELIDNSIQATHGNAERKVEVEVVLGANSTSFLVVRDNGCGMHAKGLEEFATYCLGMEARGMQGPTARGGGSSTSSLRQRMRAIGSGKISKFGVGALEAGFYIGSRIQVVTKVQGNPEVHVFVLDEDLLKQRQENDEPVYTGDVFLRSPGGIEEQGSSALKKVLTRLREQEPEMEHFTYIVLSLREEHVHSYRQRETPLHLELASIYHYYLHPEDCPLGIASINGTGGDGNDAGAPAQGDDQGANTAITLTFKQSGGRTIEEIDLGAEAVESLEKRLNTMKVGNSFEFRMEVPHPTEKNRMLPGTGLIHYYPFDGMEETRPRRTGDRHTSDDPTIEVFWEGRLVPQSTATAMSFFPSRARLEKSIREELSPNWPRRIKGMLFFDWDFPISNNKLALKFRDGRSLHDTLISKDILYNRRTMGADFANWLIDCHRMYDKEFCFREPMSLPPDPACKHYKMADFGSGTNARIFESHKTKVKLKAKKEYGTINFFREKEDECGHLVKSFSFQRWPKEVYGKTDPAKGLLVIANLDTGEAIATREWNRAMDAGMKLLPKRMVATAVNGDPLPDHIHVRIGEPASSTLCAVSVQILDGLDQAITTVTGNALRVLSTLQYKDDDGNLQAVQKGRWVAPPSAGKVYSVNVTSFTEPRELKWTISVVRADGKTPARAADGTTISKEYRITARPGNPVKCILEGDFTEGLTLSRPCGVPKFTVKLLDASENACPVQDLKSVSLSCKTPETFDIELRGVGGSTDYSPRREGDVTSLTYNDHSWELLPTRNGMLSATKYTTKRIHFEIRVVVDKIPQDLKGDFSIVFKPGEPATLELLSPKPTAAGTPLACVEAGSSLPVDFKLGVFDNWGNQTKPCDDEKWELDLQIATAKGGPSNLEQPRFPGPMNLNVVSATTTFSTPVVEWNKRLLKNGEAAEITATLQAGNKDLGSRPFKITITPTKEPFSVRVLLGNRHWNSLETFEAGEKIRNLNLKLLDQRGHQVTDYNTCKNVTCSWNNSKWRWQDNRDGGLPDLEVIHVPSAGRWPGTVTVMTNGVGGRELRTTVEYVVVPGKFSRWVAVRGHTNEILENLEVVEMTAGSSSKTCLESFAKVVAGFQPVDKYDNTIKISSISEHPELGVEGDDQSTIQLVQHASGPFRLKKLREGDLFKFPDGFNLSGGPGKASLVIRKPLTVTASGGLGSPHKASALYLPVLLKAGLPGKVLIRRELVQDEFSEKITISEPGGFEISDLEVRLEDAAGNRATLPHGGVKVQVADAPNQRLLAECKTTDSSFTMPMLTLPHKERRESVTFQVRVEAERLGRVKQSSIEWNREKTNAVTHVHMAAYSPGLAFECEKGMDGNYAVEVERRVDSPLPTLLVWVDTENDIGFLPSAESFAITITKEGSPTPCPDQYKKPVRPHVETESNAWMFAPQAPQAESAVTLNVGTYTIRCSYEEKRYEQPHSTEEVEMIMRAVPGDPSKLKPTRDPFPESLSASNEHDVGVHRRLLKDFEIRVVDRNDNVVAESLNGPVRMQIEASVGLLVASSDMPQLENASDGILTAERIGAGVFIFKDVSLQAGVGSTEGTYRLVVHSEGPLKLSVWKIDFLFTSEEKRLEDIRNAEEELARVRVKHDEYLKSLSGPETAENEARHRVAAMIKELPPDSIAKIGYADTDYVDCFKRARTRREDLKTMARKQEDDYKDMKEIHPSFTRDSKTHSTIKKIIQLHGASEHDIRCIAEIGFVRTRYHAQLLSHTAGTMMKGVYVLKKDQLTTLREEKGCGICKETIQAFGRDSSQMANTPPPPEYTGCKGYVVDMFELKDEDEGLRGTLFWALYGDMVMFDTYANAIRYRDALNGDKRRDILVEEDGTLLRRNGYMDVPKGTEGLKKLPIVFGPMPLDHKPERRQLRKEIEQLFYVMAKFKDLAGANAEVARIKETFNPNDGLKNEYENARTRLENLTNIRRVRHRGA